MKYYRLMLGKGNMHASVCFAEYFIGADYGIERDLSDALPDGYKDFNSVFIPVFQVARPEKSKIAAGLACGMLWTVCKGMEVGDFVLCPDGSGSYKVGEISGAYVYAPGQILPHRRPVRWLERSILRSEMSDALRHSSGSIATVCDVSNYREEIDRLLSSSDSLLIATDPSIENPVVFALEKHLEAFLVSNWPQTALGQNYDIYQDDEEGVGQQYRTDTGFIDILAISKDKRELLVIELKKGRASDDVVGQVLRYMGDVAEEIAEADQGVKGVIIALEDDLRIRRALSVTPNVSFYRYQVDFKLMPVD